MMKVVNGLEIRKGDNIYTLIIPQNAPQGELYDVLFQLRSFILQKINEAVEAEISKKQPQEEPKVES